MNFDYYLDDEIGMRLKYDIEIVDGQGTKNALTFECTEFKTTNIVLPLVA